MVTMGVERLKLLRTVVLTIVVALVAAGCGAGAQSPSPLARPA